MKILIVEDEPALSDSIKDYLSGEGYHIDRAFDYRLAEEYISINSYDCILLDIMLPDGNGLHLISRVKQAQPGCGIIVISAKNSLDDKITGLDLGADDYLSKPFHLSELNSRLKSVIRRRHFGGKDDLVFNEITLDTDKREVKINNEPLVLTRREFDMLLFFLTNNERVLTKEAITEHVWGDDSSSYGNLDFVYTHIKNLRKKLTDAGAGDYIRSVYGVGYKFSGK